MPTPIVYTDDADAHWTFTVTDADGDNLDWTPVEVAAGSAGYALTGTWQGAAAPTRQLKVPLDTLDVGHHNLYLKVPGGNDLRLGLVVVTSRT